MTPKLSIVDLGTVAPGTTAADALSDALATARQADALGYHRIWFAEHHGAVANASANPELLIAAAAAQTSGIRIGSGAVLLNHYSPFKVAEMFKQLEAMFPDRIDLGIGRATAGRVLDYALKRDRNAGHSNDHAAQVQEVLAWLHNAFPADHPFAGEPLIPSVPHLPQTWLLGSSPSSANMAAQMGIGYTFAGFINPAAAANVLQSYRKMFVTTPFGSGAPQAMLGVNVTVGETPEEAAWLVSSVKGFYFQIGRGDYASPVPSCEQAMAALDADQRDEPTLITNGRWPRFVAGTPDQVRDTLDQMVRESGVDEVIAQDMIARADDRHRSQALLAKAYELNPRSY